MGLFRVVVLAACFQLECPEPSKVRGCDPLLVESVGYRVMTKMRTGACLLPLREKTCSSFTNSVDQNIVYRF
jgi:hypothetical protein